MILSGHRAGGQAVWFCYGNEKRGNVSCWYAQTQNSWVLFSGGGERGDREMLSWGYGGLTSFLTTIEHNGSVRGWFLWWPDRMGFDLRSLDRDLGHYAYLLAAKAYVVEDEDFGLVGYGCNVAKEADGRYAIVPWDGLRKRLRIVSLGIDIRAEKGESGRVLASPDGREIVLSLEGSTGPLAKPRSTSLAFPRNDAWFRRARPSSARSGADRVRVRAPLARTTEVGLRFT